MGKDKCIVCGKDTEYDITTHIDFRRNYVDGAGQLCDDCANTDRSRKITNDRTISIAESKVKELSNDFELGKYVRGLFNKK